MAASKYRIYEMAKDMNMSSKRLQMILKREFDLEYKSHMSAIEEEDIGRINAYFEEQKRTAQEDREKREKAQAKAEAQAAKERDRKKREREQQTRAPQQRSQSSSSPREDDRRRTQRPNQNQRGSQDTSRRQTNRPKQYAQGMEEGRMLTPDMIREEKRKQQEALEAQKRKAAAQEKAANAPEITATAQEASPAKPDKATTRIVESELKSPATSVDVERVDNANREQDHTSKSEASTPEAKDDRLTVTNGDHRPTKSEVETAPTPVAPVTTEAVSAKSKAVTAVDPSKAEAASSANTEEAIAESNMQKESTAAEAQSHVATTTPVRESEKQPAQKPASDANVRQERQTKSAAQPSSEQSRRPDTRQGQQGRSDNRTGAHGRADNRSGQQTRSDSRQGQQGRPDNRPGQQGRSDNRPGQQGRSDYRSGQQGRPDNRSAQGQSQRPFTNRNDRAQRAPKEDAPELIAKPSRLHEHKKVEDKKKSLEKNDKKKEQNRDRTFAQKLQSKAANKEKKKEKKILKELAAQKETPDIIELPAEITVGDFARLINQSSTAVMMELIKMGVMASLNEAIGYETAEKVAETFGVLVMEPENTDPQTMFESLDFEDQEKDLKVRPPVVTVMGHVDHGKTSLLDAIRETHVTSGEAGGITQHIGASTAYVDGKKITFLDTPGHEAFTQMRMRGAQSTDIAILVVAADDGVMPQTVEAINHAKAAKVPIIIAINKMDKYEADPNRVMQELTEYGLVAEEWGGDTIMIPVSAKQKTGIDELLTMVLMVAEMEELKANPNRRAVGIVIEAQLDKGRGPTATVLVQKGTLHDSDYVVSGSTSGHIRAMFDSTGKKIKKVGPSMPALILGLSEVPEAGDMIYVVENEKIAREFAQKAQDKQRQEQLNKTSRVSLDDLHSQIEGGELKELNIIVKTDVKGTIDAVRNSLEKLSNDEVKVNVIHGAVGGITESDVLLANASNGLIIGFNVRPNQGAVEQAKNDGIDIRTYRVIYEAIEDVKQAIQGMLSPKFKEEILGRAQVRDTFRLPNGSTIAGVYVTNGKLARNAQVRLLRDDIVIHEGKIDSLRRFKDDVRELATGYEGGVGIENYNDIKLQDVIECFHMVEIAPTNN